MEKRAPGERLKREQEQSRAQEFLEGEVEMDGGGFAVVVVFVAMVVIAGLSTAGYFANRPEPKSPDRVKPVVEAFHAALIAKAPVNEVLKAAEQLLSAALQWSLPGDVSGIFEGAYQDFLREIANRPELRPGALWLGRQVYARGRPKGLLTIYDEQALQNDIMVHSGVPTASPVRDA